MATAGELYRAPVAAAAQELHVLAVDDSYVDRKVIERLLEKSSCKVTAVESGKRALQYLGLDGENSSSVDLNALKVNLIMTDYSMPGMTGYELLKRIKESSAFREIPVVIMSSENILTRIDRCLEEGAEEYILKPVKPADVKRIKDFVTRGEGQENGKARLGKRKLQEDNEPLPSSSNPHSFSPSAASPQSTSTSASSDTMSSQPSYSSSSPPSFITSAACDTASSQAPSSSLSLDSSLKRPKYSN